MKAPMICKLKHQICKFIAYLISPVHAMIVLRYLKCISTVEPQRLEHQWSHENIFKTGVVRANEYVS